MTKLRFSIAVLLAAFLLAGCGGSSSAPTAEGPPPEAPPTAYESAVAAIGAATTTDEAQNAYDAVDLTDVSGMEADQLRDALAEKLAALAAANAYPTAVAAIAAAETDADVDAAVKAAVDDVSGADLLKLREIADARKADLATMASAAEQKMALTTAAGMIDTSELETAADIAAANTAIAALKAALAEAADVSDADKAMYQGRVTAAETAVEMAQSTLDHDAQTMALTDALTDLQAIDLSDLSDQAKVDAAEAAIVALRTALENATELSAAEKTAAMTELSTANRTVMAAQGSVDTASQMMMLEAAHEALGTIDLNNLMTQAQIDAANKAIIELDEALKAATSLTDAQRLEATVDKRVAERKVEAAATILAENVGNQREALTMAGMALGEIDLEDLSDQAKIDAANEAVAALKMALDGATHLSDAAKAMYQSQLDTATETVRMAQTGMDRDGRMTAQRMAVADAVTAATAAVGAVDDTATEEQVTAADNAIAALKMAIDDAVDLGEGDTDVASAQGALDSLMPVLANAKTSRTAAMEKAEEDRLAKEKEEERKANEANAATAAKLFAAISPASGDQTTEADTARAAEIVASETGGTPTIAINFGGEAATAESRSSLVLDKDTTVAAHHGWKGNRYVEKDAAGKTITEAYVYSDEMPEEGEKFNVALADLTVSEAGAYTLTADANVNNASRIASPRFAHMSGTHTFELPEDNPTGGVMIPIAGSYYGVPGTYTCTPGDGTPCSVVRAQGGGYTFGFPAVWTFKPTDPNARVTESADTMYAVYGWWLRTPTTGSWVASAFDSYHAATAPAFTGLDALNGSATYTGGAAGKYALSSSTGGDNDSGDFTARATLKADFDNDMVTGTIDRFMSDGAAKDWSVALNKSGVSDAGAIQAANGETVTDDNPLMKTIWTRGGTAAAASGHWRGQFQEVDADSDVPAVVTGDFYSEFGNSGKMVGAFGAKTE